MRNRYVQLLRRSVWPLVRLSFTVAVFWSMYASLMNWIPRGVAAAELDDSVQLLAQLLGLLVGVLLVGTTVSLSSFDLSEPIAQISSSIASSTQSFHSEFFSSGRSRHRILRRHARRRMLARPGVRQLAFPSKDYRGEPWVIERPEWDGAWYQIASSPFASTGHSRTERRQVQALHEAVICAQLVINSVIRFRGSAATLLGLPQVRTARAGSSKTWTDTFMPARRTSME
jgi:hypothetical protein